MDAAHHQLPHEREALFFNWPPQDYPLDVWPKSVAEALDALPALATRYEVILVDDGSTDDTPDVAAQLVAAHPGLVFVVRHEHGRGYGGALRSGFAAARMEQIAFTDGDRQFRVRDLAPLAALLAGGGEMHLDVVVGHRIDRADSFVRRLYARVYRWALRIFYGLRLRDVDCAAKIFRREVLAGVAVESSGAFFSAELMIKLRASGARIAEVGIPHYPRTVGAATGARPSVVLRAVRDFWRLRIALWVDRAVALRRGLPLI